MRPRPKRGWTCRARARDGVNVNIATELRRRQATNHHRRLSPPQNRPNRPRSYVLQGFLGRFVGRFLWFQHGTGPRNRPIFPRILHEWADWDGFVRDRAGRGSDTRFSAEQLGNGASDASDMEWPQPDGSDASDDLLQECSSLTAATLPPGSARLPPADSFDTSVDVTGVGPQNVFHCVGGGDRRTQQMATRQPGRRGRGCVFGRGGLGVPMRRQQPLPRSHSPVRRPGPTWRVDTLVEWEPTAGAPTTACATRPSRPAPASVGASWASRSTSRSRRAGMP